MIRPPELDLLLESPDAEVDDFVAYLYTVRDLAVTIQTAASGDIVVLLRPRRRAYRYSLTFTSSTVRGALAAAVDELTEDLRE